MSMASLNEPPIFIIGMPRSGTTILFEKFIQSNSLGWLSNYSEILPAYPSVNVLCYLLNNSLIDLQGRKKQHSKVRFGNRYLPQPDEAYRFWDYYARDDFSVNYLLNTLATDAEIKRTVSAVSKILFYQRKQTFAAKLTGPGRITYLNSLFPDARFIHVVRDGRAVVNSLLKVGFWKEKGGYDKPFWKGGLDDVDLAPWHKKQRPEILAAIQWKKIVDSIRKDSLFLGQHRYIEIRYEDFIRSPDDATNHLYGFCGLEVKTTDSENKYKSVDFSDMNKKYIRNFDQSTRDDLDSLLGTTLAECGYDV